MWRACCLVLAACSFPHGQLPADATTGGGDDAPDASDAPPDVAGDAPSCATTPAWWNTAFPYRAPITTNAPANYTVRFDASALIALGADVRVVHNNAEIDRVLEPPYVAFKKPASGMLWLYAGPGSGTPMANAANVYLWAESFNSIAVGTNADTRFAPLPANEWTIVDDNGNRVYRAAGTGRHPAAIRNLTIVDGELSARMRVGAGGAENHNGLALRSNSMDVTMMDGYVGQLLENQDRMRLAEYVNGASPVELAAVNGGVDRLTWYALRMRLVGGRLDLFVDEQLIATATVAGADGQALGVFAYNGEVDFDDVRVRTAIAPEPTTTLGAVATCP